MNKAALCSRVVPTLISLLLLQSPAPAHVKWFLGSSEEQVLSMPKPDLFNRLSAANLIPTILALVALYFSIAIGIKLARCPMNRGLLALGLRIEPFVNLIIGVCTGTLLIQCANDYSMFAPNMCACETFPDWVVTAEGLIGWCIALGFCARLSGIALFALLCVTFAKFPAADCLDLIPLYGLATYLILNGRDRFSLDAICTTLAKRTFNLGEDNLIYRWARPLVSLRDKHKQFNVEVSHLFLRSFLGLGLMILGLDEKLLHPQLALHILNKMPALNIVAWAHIGNDMFVLCAGLTEVLVGMMLIVGSLPRLCVVFLSVLFVGTTIIFGEKELYGHMPYYGMIVAVLLRGNGVHDAMQLPTVLPLRKVYAAIRQGSREMLSQIT